MPTAAATELRRYRRLTPAKKAARLAEVCRKSFDRCDNVLLGESWVSRAFEGLAERLDELSKELESA